MALAVVAEVGLEDPGGTDRQEVLVYQGLAAQVPGGQQRLHRGRATGLGAGGEPGFAGEITEIGQALLAHGVVVVGKLGEVLLHQLVVAPGIGFAGEVAELVAGGIQQAVVEGSAFGREGRATLFDLAEAGAVAALVVHLVGEGDAFLQGLEAGLAQQDRAIAARRALDHRLGGDAMHGHQPLYFVDVQGARGQVVDVRALERHHVGDQPVLGTEVGVLGGADRGVVVPAEGLQGLLDELLGGVGGQAALILGLMDQLQHPGGEDRAPGQHLLGECAQFGVVDKLQAQQRGEDPERADLQGLFMHRAKRRGMHRHPGGGEVVVAHRLHAHHGEQARQGRQFGGGADADRAMALQVQALQLAGVSQVPGNGRLSLQHLGVDLGHQLHQVAVQRHLLAVHIRHGPGKSLADQVRTDEALVAHGQGSCGNGSRRGWSGSASILRSAARADKRKFL